MASVPNMPFASTGLPAGVAAAPEGEVNNLFASLMPALAATPVVGEGVPVVPTVSLPSVLEGDAFAETPAGDGEGGEDGMDGETLPFADFLPLVQAQSNYPVVVTRPATANAAAGDETVAAPQVASTTVVQTAPTPTATTPASVPQPTGAAVPTAGQPVVSAEATEPTPAPQGQASGAAPNPGTPQMPAGSAAKPDARKPIDVAIAATETPTPFALPTTRDAKGNVTIPVKTVPTDAASAAAPMTDIPGIVAKLQEKLDGKSAARKPAETAAVPAAGVQANTASAPAAPLLDISFVTQPAPAAEAAPLNRAAEAAPTPDLAVEHELDLAHEGEWLDQLARDISRSSGSDTPMRFRLNPNTLGHLQVELAQGDQGTHVRLTVESEAARAILADAQPKLMAEARAQGVRIAGSEVDLAGSGHHNDHNRQDARQADGRTQTFIRTARGDAEAGASVETGSAPSDRYA